MTTTTTAISQVAPIITSGIERIETDTLKVVHASTAAPAPHHHCTTPSTQPTTPSTHPSTTTTTAVAPQLQSFQTRTGIKFVITAEAGSPFDLDDVLHSVYEAYADLVLKVHARARACVCLSALAHMVGFFYGRV